MSKPKKLNEVKPREDAGSRTNEQFDYQYCQAAQACFGLLESSESVCVFCEWHDDFVTEFAASQIELYAFSQVKTKSLSKGPWTFTELFGVGKKSELNEDCPFFRMAQNHSHFRSNCKKFSFITNTGVKPDVSKFLNEISKAGQCSDLKEPEKKQFDKLWQAYHGHLAAYSETEFFGLLRLFRIEAEVGNLGEHVSVLRAQIQDKVNEFCEIDLKGMHVKRIATNLLELIRKKSQQRIKTIPVSEEALKKEKAIIASDVLDLLPLSKEGLKALQSGSADLKKNVIALSRLQRLCKKSKIPAHLIPGLCEVKVSWDLWHLDKQYEFDEHDFATLKWECVKALEEERSLGRLDEKAEEIMKMMNPKLPSSLNLTRPLIMGFILSLAAQMETTDD